MVQAERAIVLAGESYLSRFARLHRALLPVYSLIAVTEPLTAEQWSAIGWAHSESLASCKYTVDYLTRTADRRILPHNARVNTILNVALGLSVQPSLLWALMFCTHLPSRMPLRLDRLLSADHDGPARTIPPAVAGTRVGCRGEARRSPPPWYLYTALHRSGRARLYLP